MFRLLQLWSSVLYADVIDLTDEDIREFIAIWETEFGEQISADRARLEAGLLLELAWALVQPLPGESCYDDLNVES